MDNFIKAVKYNMLKVEIFFKVDLPVFFNYVKERLNS